VSDSDPNLTPLHAEGDPDELAPGVRLGKYELIKRLSVGGMAEIFLARAVGLPGFEKLVAIKRILPQLAAKPDFVEMFLDEARIAATLQHSNIVQTYDVCILSGNYIIAMEYLHGEDVRSILSASVRAKRRLPLDGVLQIMIALCSGLHYAHDKESFDGKPLAIVHRDVSPGNVIVTYEGGVKLLDFGIASAAIRAHESNTGSIKGKISYLSPEQARGAPVDRRTDVFAAGVILYELSLGRKLYRGTDYEILNQIVNGKIRQPHEVDPAYDPKLEQIVLRALNPDRDQRYQTALALQLDLEALARERGLFLTARGLKGLMGELFGRKLEAWKAAQQQGKSLVEHIELVASYDDEPEPPSEPTPERPPPGRRRTWAIGAVTGLLLLGAGALALTARHTAAPAEVTPARSAASPKVVPAPAPAPIAKPAVAIVPAPHPGPVAVKVVTHPHDAALVLDGNPVGGHSPFVLADLPEGAHTVAAQLRGYGEASKRFEVAADSPPQTLTLFLSRAHAAAPPARPAPLPARPAPSPAAPAERPAAPKLEGNGALAIASNPWCTVTIDGVEHGQTPINLALPAGKHTVMLTNPDYKIRRQLQVTITPNETLRKKLDFTE